jgi:hypothetical protein
VFAKGTILFYVIVLSALFATFGATLSDGH